MLTLDALEHLIKEESTRREVIRQHLEAALALLNATHAPQKAETKAEPTRSAERRLYMEKIVALLQGGNRPMSPAELRDEIRRELPSTTREALERAIWMELRKDKPRLVRLGEGKYGLPEWRYRWITNGSLAAQQSS